MGIASIKRQYDDLIAENYDLDPQGIAGITLDRALKQLNDALCSQEDLSAMKTLDLGMGTGLFYDKLYQVTSREIDPYGLDISKKMLDIAHLRIPDLQSEVDDAANIDQHFSGINFDLICTHFITGFVPLQGLAPKIWDKLTPGGYWSFVGATSTAFPALQKIASSRPIQMLFGNRKVAMSDLITPADLSEVVGVFDEHHFDVLASETFEPELEFSNLKEFMEFAYYGGWLTPFIEDIGLQKAKYSLRTLLNSLLFPLHDHHTIVVGLARKPPE